MDGVIRGKKTRATIPDTTQPCQLDKVNRQFRVPAPGMFWVRDSFLRGNVARVCLCRFVIDAFARRIAGWRVSCTAHAGFVLDALEQAVHQHQP